MSDTTFIYALLDDAGSYCYVGKSNNPARRFREHKAAGHILAEVPLSTWKAAETRFIALFRAQGCILRNKNNGGGGPTQGQLPWNTGKTFSAELCAKLSAAHKGLIPWNKGKTTPAETRAKQSAAKLDKIPWNKGLKGSQVAWNKGLKTPPETCAKMSAALKGRVVWNKGKKRV